MKKKTRSPKKRNPVVTSLIKSGKKQTAERPKKGKGSYDRKRKKQ